MGAKSSKILMKRAMQQTTESQTQPKTITQDNKNKMEIPLVDDDRSLMTESCRSVVGVGGDNCGVAGAYEDLLFMHV